MFNVPGLSLSNTQQVQAKSLLPYISPNPEFGQEWLEDNQRPADLHSDDVVVRPHMSRSHPMHDPGHRPRLHDLNRTGVFVKPRIIKSSCKT